jgi:branched-chain amino acid transport system ATP-binding protein
MAEPLLDIRALRKTYGALVVTDDVSLSVRPGELHAIIGPNGAGKTTLIHQISGMLPSNSGRILFSGEDVTPLPMHRRVQKGLARSFQITSILPGFSALENVALAVQARSGSSFPLRRRRVGRAAPQRGPAREPRRSSASRTGPHVPAGLLSHWARSASSSWRSRSRPSRSSCCSTSRSPAPATRNPSAWSRPCAASRAATPSC